MRRPILTARRWLALAATLALLLSLLPASWAHAVSSRPRRVLDFVLRPVTHLLHNLGVALRGRAEDRLEIGSSQARIEDYYAQLLAYSRQLEESLVEAQGQVTLLSQTRRQAAFTGYQLLPASVVTGPDARRFLVTINRGVRQGVAAGQAVAAGASVVGRVREASGSGAVVQLVSDPKLLLDVRLIAPTPGQATLQTRAQLRPLADRQSFETIVSKENAVQQGDVAHLSDQYWPAEAQGLIVGRVVKVEPNPENPTLQNRVVVEALPRLGFLTRVFVLVPAEEAAR